MYLHVCSLCFSNGKKFPHALKDYKRNTKKREGYCFTVPQSKQKSINRLWYRTFVNTTVTNGESVNWRADLKMASDVSYASIVKVNNHA